VATFGDGAPALVRLARGAGAVWLAAFHPGLAYFRPALPDSEPACKGSTDENYNHWVPTEFSPTAAALIALPAEEANLTDTRPAVASHNLVEVGVVTASKIGTVFPCINWAGRALPGLVVTLGFELPTPTFTATLASGGQVTVGKSAGGWTTFLFDLDVAADAVIVRWTN
jgi:hypothetical protein